MAYERPADNQPKLRQKYTIIASLLRMLPSFSSVTLSRCGMPPTRILWHDEHAIVFASSLLPCSRLPSLCASHLPLL